MEFDNTTTRKHKFGAGLHKFIWGPRVEFGDCVFYTILTEILLGLIWLFTLERIGIGVEFSLIPWVGIVFLIWREYFRHNPKGKGKAHGNSNT